MNLSCPHCGFARTRSLEMVWLEGTQRSDSSTRASFWLWGRGFGLGGARARGEGVAATLLAHRAAPPARRSIVRPLVYWLVMYFAGPAVLRALHVAAWPAVVAGTAATLGVLVVAHRLRHNFVLWPRRHAEWARHWICLRCAQEFVPAIAGHEVEMARAELLGGSGAVTPTAVPLTRTVTKGAP